MDVPGAGTGSKSCYHITTNPVISMNSEIYGKETYPYIPPRRPLEIGIVCNRKYRFIHDSQKNGHTFTGN